MLTAVAALREQGSLLLVILNAERGRSLSPFAQACDKIKAQVSRFTEAAQMQIQSFATIPLEQDEPVPAIRRFVRLLREGAVSTDRAEIDLNLIATSARGRTTVQAFRPERTKGAPFERALEITEELMNLGVAQIKSLHFLLSAEGFRWKGASEGSSAKLLLLDGKSFQRKHRFDLSAVLIFEATGAEDPSIEKMLAEIARASRIQFKLQTSSTQLKPNEPGRATAEIFVTVLSWMELIEEIGAKVRAPVSLAGRFSRSPTTSTAAMHGKMFELRLYRRLFRSNLA